MTTVLAVTVATVLVVVAVDAALEARDRRRERCDHHWVPDGEDAGWPLERCVRCGVREVAL
jgi:hypothetical protein